MQMMCCFMKMKSKHIEAANKLLLQLQLKSIITIFLFAATLVQNYRSHSTLLDIPNNLFYHGSLVAAANQEELRPPAWTELDSTSTKEVTVMEVISCKTRTKPLLKWST